MPKITIDCVREFCKENRDIILPALCIFGYGLAIGLALSGAGKGASIKVITRNGNVTLDDVVITGVNSPAFVLDD